MEHISNPERKPPNPNDARKQLFVTSYKKSQFPVQDQKRQTS